MNNYYGTEEFGALFALFFTLLFVMIGVIQVSEKEQLP